MGSRDLIRRKTCGKLLTSGIRRQKPLHAQFSVHIYIPIPGIPGNLKISGIPFQLYGGNGPFLRHRGIAGKHIIPRIAFIQEKIYHSRVSSCIDRTVHSAHTHLQPFRHICTERKGLDRTVIYK